MRVVVFDARGCGRIEGKLSAETIASLIPDSRLVIFEKSGHSPQIEEAGKFEAVVREFLHEVLADAGSE
jgi:proline iminopeptidase